MFEMSNNDYQLFITIVKMRQITLLHSMEKYLKRFYSEKDLIITDHYIIAKGSIPVMLVAHLDTVFETPPSLILYDQRQHLMWSPQGLGADDRAGVFSILKILSKGYLPSVCFTTDEEIGNYGSSILIDEIKSSPIPSLKYIIQLDRQGQNDCVFYQCNNRNFTEYVESFGFITAPGSYTDISNICPTWKIAGVNLSIGYYNEHSTKEILNTYYMYMTINKVFKMLDDAKNLNKPFKYIVSQKKNNIFYDDELVIFPNSKQCFKCYKYFPEDDLFKIKIAPKTYQYCCIDCANNVDWCIRCGEPFIPNKKGEQICADCNAHIHKNHV